MTVPFDVEAAFATFAQPVSIFSSDGVYVYINPAGEKLLGLTASDLVGKTYLQIFPDLVAHPYHQAFMRVAAGGTSEVLEFHYEPMNRWSSQQLSSTRGHVIVIWQDITERKQAERALQDSLAKVAETQRQFRLMIEWMPQLAWWAKPDGFIDYYNPRWYAYTGTTEADMEGWGWQSVHDPALLPSVLERWRYSIATGAPFEMEFPLRRQDGVFRWFLTRVAPLRNDQGEIIRWVGINTDIDDQKRALALVADTLESMSDAFFALDRDWKVVRVNRNQERASNVERADSLGRVFWELFPSTAAPTSKYWIEYHRVMEERVASHFEEYYAPLKLWTEVDAFPSPDGGIVVFFRDISDRKRAELQRADLLAREQQARAAAEAADRSKDEFLAMLGHELRNPLAPIATALELMRQREPATAQRERTVIERQIAHLVRLVDDLLDVSRITRGKVELSITRVSVAEVVAKALETASPVIEQRRHTVAIEVPPGLVVDADVHRLEQVLSNLLTNAAKYTPPSGVITVAAERKSDVIALRVSDNGVGISPELLPVVFDLFVQGQQNLDRAQGGLGLGLAIVRRLVELHGGHVTAESQGVGRGSAFSVHFPIGEPAAGADEAPPMPRVSSARAVDKRILVVDDNEDAADLLADMLQTMGYETRTAYDGPSALRILESFTPDAAILDIGLPVMDGYELARLIRGRANLAGLKLLALTGYGQANDRERTAEAGFDDHLVKPVDIARLSALLDTMLVSPIAVREP